MYIQGVFFFFFWIQIIRYKIIVDYTYNHICILFRYINKYKLVGKNRKKKVVSICGLSLSRKYSPNLNYWYIQRQVEKHKSIKYIKNRDWIIYYLLKLMPPHSNRQFWFSVKIKRKLQIIYGLGISKHIHKSK